MTDWTAFDAALEQYQGVFWWRDDDAITDTDSLHRLMALADSVDAPLTLAVIPANLEASLPDAVAERNVTVAVHGWSHTNHAPVDEKKAEFRAHRPREVLLNEAAEGKKRLDEAFGKQSLPLFIPPWNRMIEGLELSDIQYRGVSVFGQREITDTNGLVRFDAHIDPIDWRGARSAIDLQIIINELADLMASKSPIGIMTHHLVHDEAIWELITVLITRLKQAGATWGSAHDLLAFTGD